MAKFVSILLRFIAYAAVIYLVLVILLGEFAPYAFLRKNLPFQSAYGMLFTRLNEAETRKKVDILVFGSSHAYRGFDPRIFKEHGLDLFVLGSSNQTPLQTLILAEDYVDRLNPEVIIVETYPGVFGLDGVESSIDLLSNKKVDLDLIQHAFEINHLKTYNTLLYSVFWNVIHRNEHVEKPKNKKDSYVLGGYIESELAYYKPTIHNTRRWRLHQEMLEAFSELIEFLNDREVLLVNAPMPQAYYGAFANNAQFDSLMQQQGHYVNLNGMSALNDSIHFYDFNHLNQLGVEEFNKELINVLLERYDFPNL